MELIADSCHDMLKCRHLQHQYGGHTDGQTDTALCNIVASLQTITMSLRQHILESILAEKELQLSRTHGQNRFAWSEVGEREQLSKWLCHDGSIVNTALIIIIIIIITSVVYYLNSKYYLNTNFACTLSSVAKQYSMVSAKS